MTDSVWRQDRDRLKAGLGAALALWFVLFVLGVIGCAVWLGVR